MGKAEEPRRLEAVFNPPVLYQTPLNGFYYGTDLQKGFFFSLHKCLHQQVVNWISKGKHVSLTPLKLAS